jgi:uncharacterized membrane protein/YHS domain-containing protein
VLKRTVFFGPDRLLAIGVLMALFLPGATGQEATATRPAINRYCPVLTDQEADPNFTTTYQGQTIAFCCGKCLAKFEGNPQRYAGRLAGLTSDDEPAGVNASADENTEHGHGHDQALENAESDHESHAGGTEGAHEHMHEHEQPTAHGLARLIAWLGKFHPPMVNFPIAMLLGAAVAEVLLITTRRPLFADAGRFCLWFGAIGALAAAVLGWFFGGFHLSDESWILTTHRWLGTSTALWSLVVLALGERSHRAPTPQRRRAFRLALLGSALLVGVTGFFGGSLIYGLEHYAW